MQIIRSIQSRIYELRGERIMLVPIAIGIDLAILYEVETRILNQAVKRNIERFPKDFMFKLSEFEWQTLSSQIMMISQPLNPSSQIVMMGIPKNRTGKYLPYAFTEQGVAMLSGVLNSDKAISMNIAIMRAFVEIRRLALMQADLKDQLKEIKQRLGEHDTQLNHIYEAIETLLDEKAARRKWEDRERIGFK
jgi:hypothetical protein